VNSTQVVTAADVDPDALHAFLSRFYPTRKAEFLRLHGEWWHRGHHNRWVVTLGGEIAGYCAVIPTRCLIAGEPYDAAWWVDLVVAPEHRGGGLQRLLDARARGAAPLVLGFPNALAAKIHHRHGWGVRDDVRVHMCPLRPTALRRVKEAAGWRGAVLQVAAVCAEAVAAPLRVCLRVQGDALAWQTVSPDADLMAGVFARSRDRSPATTLRDPAFLGWRYLSAPYRGELSYWLAGAATDPSIVMIARTLVAETGTQVRVLDLFGDLGDHRAIRAALAGVCRDAVRAGAAQITMMSVSTELRSLLKRVGFLVTSRSRFCWTTSDQSVKAALGEGRGAWVLGDADNDEP